ncbi:hypothetical protein MHW47_12370 [Streptomyces sp. OfavH-34-F]|uniref:hypothetical protein n=1 Tax=Streptomyces sp. OfavH-34-F TaxID=2917760 RepID=UPI001EF3CADA|nr:hypothetical protein [Streptomyces sp. OfavH-34-F]MCG7525232.1 hypothetical protein [Streptomyces sp. OfavH-34-F]
MNTSGATGSSRSAHEWINSAGVVIAVALSLFALYRDYTREAEEEVREAMKVNAFWTGPAAAPTGLLVENQQDTRIMGVTVRLEVGDKTVQRVRFDEVHSCRLDWFTFGSHQPKVRTDAVLVLQFRDASGNWWQLKPGSVLDRIDAGTAGRPGGDDLVTAWKLQRETDSSSDCG